MRACACVRARVCLERYVVVQQHAARSTGRNSGGGVAARSCQTAHDEVRLGVYREAVCVCVWRVCASTARVRVCVLFARACFCARVCLCARVWLEIDPKQRASEHTFGHSVACIRGRCFADFPYYLCGFGQFERGGGFFASFGQSFGQSFGATGE